MSNVKAELVMLERRVLEVGFVEVIVCRLPEPLVGSTHGFKHRLAYVVDGECVLRYDNESGQGDHRHIGGRETTYAFASFDQLLDDFLADVAAWKGG